MEQNTTPNNEPVVAQTGVTTPPVQVENVQYNVNVGRAKSKMGVIMLFTSVCVWFIALLGMALLLSVYEFFWPDPSTFEEDAITLREMFVFVLAAYVPLLPLAWFTISRLTTRIKENVANVEDIFFKRTVRFNLVISGLIALIWVFVFVYNVLGRLILNDAEITMSMISYSFIFAFTFVSLAGFFLYWELKTRR